MYTYACVCIHMYDIIYVYIHTYLFFIRSEKNFFQNAK